MHAAANTAAESFDKTVTTCHPRAGKSVSDKMRVNPFCSQAKSIIG
jgi:hypothetical protein